jgi:hypothetical protein
MRAGAGWVTPPIELCSLMSSELEPRTAVKTITPQPRVGPGAGNRGSDCRQSSSPSTRRPRPAASEEYAPRIQPRQAVSRANDRIRAKSSLRGYGTWKDGSRTDLSPTTNVWSRAGAANRPWGYCGEHERLQPGKVVPGW